MAEKRPYSPLILTGVAIGLFLSVNFLFDELGVSFDLSENRLFSLSPQSYAAMDNLSRDVTIYGLYETGNVNKLIDEVLRRYASASGKIEIEYVDPVRNPDFIKRFEHQGNTPAENSLIVSGSERFTVLSEADLFEIGMDVQRRRQVRSLVVERRVTGALLYVEGGTGQTVAVLKGHGEAALPQILRKGLELENYEMLELDLRSAPGVPEEADLLVINLPERDLSPAETGAIAGFLDRGGRALLLISPIFSGTPNFSRLLSPFGIDLSNRLVEESDPGYYAQIPIFLMPRLKSHEILAPLATADMRVVAPFSQLLIIRDLNDPAVRVEPLLETSEKAGLRDGGGDDPTGPFPVAAAVTIASEGASAKHTRIVVVGSGAVSDPDILRDVPGNVNFIMNCFSWLAERERDLAIRPKSLLSFRLTMNRRQSLIYSGIAVILIPLLIFGAGLGVRLWRRSL